MNYWNNFVPASRPWLEEKEQPTLRQARLNALVRSTPCHTTRYRVLEAIHKAFQNRTARYFPLFNNVPCPPHGRGPRTREGGNTASSTTGIYNGVPYGSASVESAWIYGLQQNEENRSNLALVNTGEIDDSSSTFEITIYDGSGESEPRTRSVTVGPRRWTQENGILGNIRQGYVQARKTSGNNPFVTYGVINDGGRPGERSGDGAFLPAQEWPFAPWRCQTRQNRCIRPYVPTSDKDPIGKLPGQPQQVGVSPLKRSPPEHTKWGHLSADGKRVLVKGLPHRTEA